MLLVLAGLVPLGFLHPGTAPPRPDPLGTISPDVPTWLVGDSWTFETHAVTRDGPNWTSAWNNLTFTVSSRMQALQDGVYLYLYNSSTAGDLAVVGDALVPGTGSTVHYSFTSSNVRGYTWNERGDLATVKVNETFSGSGTAVLPLFGTRPLTAAGNLTALNRPPEEDFDFPLRIGDAWNVTSTLNTTGAVHLHISMPIGQDIDLVQPLNGDAPVDAHNWANGTESVSVANTTFDTVRVHSASAGGAATDRWYAPNASNYVKLETHNTSGPAAYTHTWTNLTAYALVNPVVLVSVVLFPDTVGPGGPFEVRANTTAANAAIRLIIPAINFTATGSTDTTGAFRLTVSAPAVNDRTPANTDVGSHGVLVEVTYLFGTGFGVATISLVPPDLTVSGFAASPTPVADGVPTDLTTTVSVTTDVPIYAPVDVTFVAEDVDRDRDGRMDLPIDVFCGRSACANTTVFPVVPGRSVPASATWTPSPASLPADVRVSAVVDPADRYAETNEANNVVVATVHVEAPNLIPSNVTVDLRGAREVFDNPAALGFVSPLISLAPSTLVNLTVRVRNAGIVNASRSSTVAFYNTTTLNGSGDPPFAQSAIGPIGPGVDVALPTIPWTTPAGPGTYFVNVTVDYLRDVRETRETDNTFVLRFRVYDLASAPDLVPVSVSIPAKASVNRSTSITARVRNVGVSNASAFQVAFYNDTQRSSPFAVFTLGPLGAGATSSWISAPWAAGSLGSHVVRVEVDLTDAVPEANETNNTAAGTITVYDVPLTTLVVGAPRIVTNTTYILPTTPLSFIAQDRTGEGAPTVWYRIDTGAWTWSAPGPTFVLPAGPHTISYNSTDLLGGQEPTHEAAVFVDGLPPETTLTVSNGTGGKLLSLSAVDLASGVDWTEYRIDGGAWTRYNGTPVLLSSPGNHTVEFRSADRLGNTEPAGNATVLVEGAPTGAAAGFNVKPILALVFGAALLLAGWFAAPTADPPRRRRWFLTVALPPALIELATGAVSLAVPEMAVPGGSLGLPVDVALLLIGLLVILFSRRRALRPA